VPDGGVECEDALAEACPESFGGAGVVAFEAELVFQGPDDRFDPLTQPGREHFGRWFAFVIAGGTDERVSQGGGGFFDPGAGEAFVAHDRAGCFGDRLDVQ
jgi:hypothetical protein